MNLITVTNNIFAPCVFNLIQSYKLNSSNEEIYVIYYDLSEEYINLFKKTYGQQINLVKLENECEHAYNPRFYFSKGYALKIAHKINKPFMMCDASHAFVSKTYELEYHLEKDTRFFIEYPEDIFKNKFWTTKKCFELSKCDTNEYKNMQSYWSGFHCYIPTDENKEMIYDQYKLMLNKEIAGPSNLEKYPDGQTQQCIAHRNDQSVLSLMIQKYKFNQKFNLEKYNRYGDLQTAKAMLPSLHNKLDHSKICLYSRYSKFNNFSFINDELLNNIKNIFEIYKIDRNTGIVG